jgi:hypothetical protein
MVHGEMPLLCLTAGQAGRDWHRIGTAEHALLHYHWWADGGADRGEPVPRTWGCPMKYRRPAAPEGS